MKLLLGILSLLLILLLVGLWVGPGSYPERWRTQERSTKQTLENKERKADIEKMKAELDDAASGSAAIEERARSELGMTGKGETFYEVILRPETKKALEDKKKDKSIKIKNPLEPNRGWGNENETIDKDKEQANKVDDSATKADKNKNDP